MNKVLLVTGFIFLLFSCRSLEKKKPVAGFDEKLKMMDADRAFSDLSAQKGVRAAFLEYIDNDGVLLRPDQYPLVGGNAVSFLSQMNDSTASMQWKPVNGAIAQSGELGYTYGVYSLKSSDTTIYGTYVSIWRKQPNGTWKFVLDSGNEGIGTGEEENGQ
jgi:ketosteroid isomerase-like protein